MRELLSLSLILLAHPWCARGAEGVVFASYNLENYLGEEQAISPSRQARPKAESAIVAQIGILHDIAPDILGVCEMGRPEQFTDFRRRLEAAGLPYAEAEYVQAADPDRHLALLSRFPIVARQSEPDVTFDLNGTPLKVMRGILDVTVRIRSDYDLRLVGVHLKSKLPVPEGEAIIRRHEAQLLRRHVEKIMATDPMVNLLLYGDFNETRNEPSIREISGPKGSAMFMTELPAMDSAGERWTHYWKEADIYSRIDYLFASPALLREIDFSKAVVHRSDDWFQASDHRAISALIMPKNRRR